MKKMIILVLVSLVVLGFNGCCLDQQVQEQRYIDSHTWVEKPDKNNVKTEYVYILINNDGSYTYVTIDENNDVWDLDGNYLFSLDD